MATNKYVGYHMCNVNLHLLPFEVRGSSFETVFKSCNNSNVFFCYVYSETK